MGLVHHIMETGDWVVPTLAGEPFMEKPPLFFLTAAQTAKLFSAILPPHDGARLASGLYVALALIFAALTGEVLHGKGFGFMTMVILMGCVGLLPHAHLMITDTALLAGFSMALYGLASGRRRPVSGGAMLGLGTGVGFLSKGLLAPLVLGAVVVVLLLSSPAWRNRVFAATLGVGTVVALPWLTVWPAILYVRAPELFDVWFWENNLGRFLGSSPLATRQETGYYLKALTWFTWPALPLALIAVWRRRGGDLRGGDVWRAPAFLLPLVMGAILLAVLMGASATRELYLLPVLLPLALLATPVVREETLPAHRFVSGGVITLLGCFAGAIWGVWLMVMVHAPLDVWFPAVVPPELTLMQKHGGVPFHGWGVALALLATGAWVYGIGYYGTSARRLLVGWTGGVTLVWMLLMTLWLPVIDYGKSYRGMVKALQRAMPACYSCLASRRLGEPQRAMLHYVAHVTTQRAENGAKEEACDLLLVARHPAEVSDVSDSWRVIWEGGRPGDLKEWYTLYQTVRPSQACSGRP